MFSTKNLMCSSALVLCATGASAVTMTTVSTDANLLANEILGAGITLSSESLTGATGQAGTFSGGGSSIGIESGIILSTGDVGSALGPNTSDSTGIPYGTPGLPDLDALVAPNTTFDGVKLDIQFTAETDTISFDYVFASDEYNEFAFQSVNDVFALFLNGENLALVPGTSTVVSIDTVNGGNPFGTGAVNDEFFNNNDLDDGGPFFNVEYDGFTDVFTATGTVVAGEVNTLSFQIADTGDSVWDSAVFIAANSFVGKPPPVDPPDKPDTSTVIPLPATGWMLLGGLGLLSATSRRGRKKQS